MKQRITYYIFFAVLFLIAWGIYFILEYGNYIIEDVPGTVEEESNIGYICKSCNVILNGEKLYKGYSCPKNMCEKVDNWREKLPYVPTYNPLVGEK